MYFSSSSALVIGGLVFWLVFYSLGEYLSKEWEVKSTYFLAFGAIVSYSLGVMGWLMSLRAHGSLTILTTIFSVFGVVAGVFIGWWVFKEKVDILQWCGIVLAMISIVFLCYK